MQPKALRPILTALLTGLLLLTLASCQKSKGPGKSAGPVSIEQVRVGLPHGRTGKQNALSRNGVWAPVFVTLKAGKDNVPAESYRLAIESNDTEGSLYRYTVPVPALTGEEERTIVAYVQPGGPTTEFTPILERTNGEIALTGTKFERKQDRYEVLEANDQLIFSIGAQLTGFEQTIEAEIAERANNNNNNNNNGGAAGEKAAPQNQDTDKGRRRFAYVENDVSLLPDQWFGYDAADLVVLSTRQKEWLDAFTGDRAKHQRQALMEWVRRGGRLVLSVGKEGETVAKQLLRQDMPLLNPDDFAGDIKEGRADLKDVRPWIEASLLQRDQKMVDLFVPTLIGDVKDPRRSPRVQVLLRDVHGLPLILQTSCGLGRVLIVLFDVDSAPFAGWDAERKFWEKILKEMAPEPAPSSRQNNYTDDRKPSLYSDLQRGQEIFDNDPINFGWVALFVAFYILLVGPLDYFILKKIFKRMELTWLTFPAVVLLVSVTSYAIAYSLKGTELRINKVDIVEFDLTESKPRAYGRSWVTLFSPRIANFTVGLQPSADGDGDEGGWFPKPSAEDKVKQPVSWIHRDIAKDALPAYPTTLAVVAAPERTMTREGETNLFPKPYEYAENANGLERVPIPVWATRTFSASYSVPFDPAKTFTADLRFGTDGKPQGSITNHLPVGLTNVVILYGGGEGDNEGKCYNLSENLENNNIPAGATISVDQLFKQGNGKPFNQLFQGRGPEDEGRRGARGNQALASSRNTFYPLMKGLFFYDLTGTPSTEEPNTGLRNLDQSWRVKGTPKDNAHKARREGDLARGELVLVGSVMIEKGNTEAMTHSSAAPTRVWLDHLPGTMDKRPSLDGQMQQETYIRVYLPIRAREQR